jgi:hypothetical protein
MTMRGSGPLDYESSPSGGRPPVILGVIAGVVAGSVLSFAAYWFGRSVWPVMLGLVLAIKVGAGLVLRRRERTRGFGVGVLISLALGVLIFMGICGKYTTL